MADETILLPVLPLSLSRFLYVSFKLNPKLDSLRCFSIFSPTTDDVLQVIYELLVSIELCVHCVINIFSETEIIHF